ncbi:MAG: transposase [Okeania sp. SIO2G4]|uniref:transposase n=1 Tax=unclassified Okeania TaxID=2634635 RepID=UPI0013BAAB50|nr:MULTISPECIES: transposase [unclassified Okeania]NEP06391.1 transposase [Okeania sp. SIO4D6]NEP72284.1 transposase [Okeania sp. SIO2G5]NEP96263.1 transposase [Okeania sp. SIO2F5]NEQ90563.1 transposase [Okeania sp. SIO2G4]
MHLVLDPTGVKVYGEGEWKTRIHGVGKRRTWRKLYLGVSEATGEIATAMVSTNDVSDEEAFSELLDALEGEIAQVSGTGYTTSISLMKRLVKEEQKSRFLHEKMP